jgi:myo-inositol 2-dehydrogenase / D-chiro-inositol 1-dehydrogenase
MTQSSSTSTIGRREFLAGAAAAAASFTIVRPSAVRGTEANETLEVGLIGCGGRGMWITELFNKHGKYRFVACADYYQDKVAEAGKRLKIDPSRQYTGLSGYKKLLEGKLDVALIESPPYFHPEQAAAAVDAGKHVYLAKPIAVDVPGCKTVLESGKRAGEKKQVFLIDFQTRADPHYREAAKKVHDGQLGRLICGEAKYPCGHMAMQGPTTPEDRLRYWYCTREISGDFIVEQSIHAIDVASWFLNAAPIRVYGTGASKGLRAYGNIWDHFNLVYEFPDQFALSFNCVQMVHGSPNEIPCRIYGQEGTVDTDYFSHVWVHSGHPDRNMEAKFENLYTSGTVVNVKEFHEAVSAGKYDNPTVAPSVRSNLTAIMGRNAAYEGRPITWDELMKSTARMQPDLKGLKA